MKNRSYSQPIAEAINTFLTTNDYIFQFDEDEGVFSFGVIIPSRAKSLRYTIILHDYSYTIHTSFPLGPDPTNEQELTHIVNFLTRANYGLRIGNFEMNMDSGEIFYKVYCNCCGIEPNDSMIRESIECPAAMFERYGNGILDILFNNLSAKLAVRRCESVHDAKVEAMKKKLEAWKEAKGEEETEVISGEPEDQKSTPSFADLLMMLAEKASKDRSEAQQVDDSELPSAPDPENGGDLFDVEDPDDCGDLFDADDSEDTANQWPFGDDSY